MRCPLLIRMNDMVSLCEELKKDTIDLAFRDNDGNIVDTALMPMYCWTPRYQHYWQTINDEVSICDMLGISILDKSQSEMIERVKLANTPEAIIGRSRLENHIDFIKKYFAMASDQIKTKLQLLENEELSRLDEALCCYLDGCNYATVAMSVSAIEFRLFSLMKFKCPNAKLEELTLGQLIREYLNNKSKYGAIIPEKHEPLLQHCNVYRIFSVHPKKEKITKSMATSIINMTFAFLLDQELKLEKEVG